jgi:PAS domain S-box-containing protein
MLIIDETTNIEMINLAAIKLCGGSESDILQHRPGNALRCVHSIEDPRGCGYAKDCKICAVRNGIESLIAKGGNINGAELLFSLTRNGEPRNVWMNVGVEPLMMEGRKRWCIALNDITESKQAKEKVQKSELKYRSLIENSSDIIYCLDVNGQYQFTNQLFASFLEKTPDYFIGKTLWDVYDKEKADMLYEATKRLFRTGISESLEVEVFLPDKTSYFWATTNPIKDETGKVILSLTNATDITEKVKLTEALANEKQRLFSIIEGTNAGTWEWNIQTGETVYNDRWADFLGYTLEELSPVSIDTCTKYSHPEDLKLSCELLEKHFKGELKYYECEVRMKHKNGDWIWVLDRGKVYKWDENGKPLLMSGTHQEINDRKMAEHALEESEKQFSLFMNHLPALAFIKDPESRIVFVNNSMKLALGASKWLGLKTSEIFDRETAERLNIDDKKTLLDGYQNIEESFPNLDGKVHHYKTQKFIIPRLGLKPLLGGIAIDVTERKHAEQALIESEIKLSQLNADKDKIFSIIAHDLRSPFNGFLGFTQLMVEELDSMSTTEIKKVSALMNKSATELYNLLENLLNWTRMKQGLISFKPQKVVLSGAFQDTVEILRPNAEAKNISINYSETDKTIVLADTDMLKTVLRNLVSNAIKFTNIGGVITINSEQTPSDVIISVSDNGIGIESDNIAKLFDIGQVHTTTGTADEKGTGLGLLLCKDFVEKHGGKIWVESEVGIGSRFKFTLPVSSI